MIRYLPMLLLGFLGGCNAEQPNDAKELNLDLTDGAAKTVAVPSFLTTYNSCDQIKQVLLARAEKKIEEQMAQWPEEAPRWHHPPECGDAVSAPAVPGGSVSEGGREGVDYSGTNNQENGVDESDIIKVDGKFFYLLQENKLNILGIGDEGILQPVSSIELASEAQSLLIVENKAYVFSNQYLSDNHRYYSVLRVDIIDLGADRQNLRLEKTYYWKGDLSGARRIANKIHVASFLHDQNAPFTWWPDLPENYYQFTPEEQDRAWAEAKTQARALNQEILATFDFLKMLPTQLELVGEELVEVTVTEQTCQKILASTSDDESGFLSLLSLDPKNDQVKSQIVRGGYPTVYASPNQIIVTSYNWNWSEDGNSSETVVHQFKLDPNHEPYYTSSVAVPGTIRNSFSLSEYNGYVRIATTIGRNWRDENSKDVNNLYILGDNNEGKLGVVSKLENLAPGESIWAARFVKDKGYLVTFEQIDPLFTLDLSDPSNPRVVGELKVPGVSTYLQDIGNGTLLAIGYEGNADGLTGNTSVSLFDVNNFAAPELKTSLTLKGVENDGNEDGGGWSSSWSGANSTHLAINYFAPKGLTAIPFSASKGNCELDNEENWTCNYERISKLHVIDTRPGSDVSIVGEVDHSNFYANLDENSYWIDAEIRRSYFVGGYLYAFSAKGITATRLADMVTTGTYDNK